MSTPNRVELAAACDFFFGAGVGGRIDEQRLSRRYRELAFATHPDRAESLDTNAAELTAEFLRVQRAYVALRDVLRRFGAIELRTAEKYVASERRRRWHPIFGVAQRVSSVRPPRRNMTFGLFLYYCGRLSMRQVVEARTWQRASRPAVGDIAMGWAMLDAGQVAELLQRRQKGVRFCEEAVERGFLSGFQRLAILGRQLMIAPSLDYFWLSKGWLDRAELEEFKRRARGQRISAECA